MRICFFLLFAVSCCQGFSQRDSVSRYYLADWTEASNKKSATYFRVGECDKKEKYSGVVHDYYLSGKLYSQLFLRKNQKEGMEYVYYESGAKQSEGFFDKDRESGDWIYYYENGNKSATGFYVFGVKSGNWTEYYENGIKKTEVEYSFGKRKGKSVSYHEDGSAKEECTYVDGLETGISKTFYEGGGIKSEGQIEKGNSAGIWKYYFKNGKLKEEGAMEKGRNVGKWKYYYMSGDFEREVEYKQDSLKNTIELMLSAKDSLGNEMVIAGNGKYKMYSKEWKGNEEGVYKNGYKEGVWRVKSDVSKKGYTEEYANTKFVKGQSWDSVGNQYVYTEVIIMAEYEGGMTELMRFLSKQIRYPEVPAERGISGKVFIEFYVDVTGEVKNCKIKRGVHVDLDAEALRVAKMMPAWKPEVYRGQKKRTRYMLPINFKIQ